MSTVPQPVPRKPLPLTASTRLHSSKPDLRDTSEYPHPAHTQPTATSTLSHARIDVAEGIPLLGHTLPCDVNANVAVDFLKSHERPTGVSVEAASHSDAEVLTSACPVATVPSSIPTLDSDTFELAVIDRPVIRASNKRTPPRVDTCARSVKVDKAILSRNIYIGCLFLSWCVAIACITFGVYITPSWRDLDLWEDYQPIHRRNISGYGITSSAWGLWCAIYLIPLALNLLITICTDSLGFIQTASLRWSLQQDGVLMYNSNLRLLTATKRNPAHRWYINVVSAFCASVCYAATPILSTWGSDRDRDSRGLYWIPQGIIIVYLGLAIMGQAALATWCLFLNLKSIPTWSSNPLNTTLACLELDFQRQRGRCLMSVHQSQQSAITKYPYTRQPSAGEVSHFAAPIVHWLWVLTVVALFWGIAMVLSVELVKKNMYDTSLTDFGFGMWESARLSISERIYKLWYSHGLIFALDPPVLPEFSINARNSIHICILMLVHGPLVFGLHCIEMLVNVSRDEGLWRRAASKDGVQSEYNAISAALRSPQTVLLFLGKAAAHWCIGQSFNIINGRIFNVMTGPVFLLTAVLALLAYFGKRLAYDRPKGPQPATYGHIQTLADLIDVWSETMYWGDKGAIPGSNIRHAGTLHEPLKQPQLRAPYSGQTCCKANVLYTYSE